MKPCAVCGEKFEPTRSTARYCGATCRQRARRGTPAPQPDSTKPEHGPASKLVVSVRDELEKAGVLDTYEGQLALVLARKLSDVDATGSSGLSKELRSVMADALAHKQDATPPAPAAESEDDLEKARRKRDEARQAAGLT